MNDQDKKRFQEAFNALSEYYQQKENLSKPALQIYFAALQRFDFDQVQWAISKHVQSASNGQFYPKVADIIRIIEGGDITTDQVLAAARTCDTPLGLLCRIQIGSWDLKNQTDMFYLKQRAEECLHLLTEWKARAISGDYSDHEISMMLKHNINPCQPFYTGLPAPSNSGQIVSRVSQIVQTERHKFLLEKQDDETPEEPLQMPWKVKAFLTSTIFND